MGKEEALQVLEKFVDNALLTSANTIQILHGKGTGVLRNVVKQKLREYGGNIARSYHPEDGGGDGVTMVDLARDQNREQEKKLRDYLKKILRHY